MVVFTREAEWMMYRTACGDPSAWNDGKRSFFIKDGFAIVLEVH
jgi:hypothetical protein